MVVRMQGVERVVEKESEERKRRLLKEDLLTVERSGKDVPQTWSGVSLCISHSTDNS